MALVLTIVLVTAACGGNKESVAPTTTVIAATTASVTTAPSTTTTVAATTTMAASTTMAATTTAVASTTVAVATTTVASTPTNPELDQAFAVAVREYIATTWAGWAQGESLGECLAANASDIDDPAKQGVIDFGLDDVFNHISRTDGYSLGVVWDDCAATPTTTAAPTITAAPTTTPSTTTVAPVSTNPELDQAFANAVEDFIVTDWGGWPDGVILGECLAANASLISDPAKQGVIEYGLEQVWDHISQTAGSSLNVVWDDCETVVASSKAEAATAAVADRPDALTFAPLTTHGPFPAGIEAALQAAVDTEFSAALEKAGISVAVSTDDMLWTYASGSASSTAEMSPNTPMLIRSTSKVFLSALILNQIEQGLFELGDTLESVLSDHPDYPSINPAIYNPAVTVQEMLSMRSGIASRDEKSELASSVYSNPVWNPVDVLGLTPYPWVEPGNFAYSDSTSVLLGMIAEHHGGQDLNALYRDTLFEPLGITAGLGPRNGIPVDIAHPYEPLGPLGDMMGIELSGFGDRIDTEIAAGWTIDPAAWYIGSTRLGWASAGIFTTAENMARWGYELYSPNGSAISESNRTKLLNSFGPELVDFENRMQYYGYHVTKSDVFLEDGTVLTVYGHPGGGGNFVSKLAYSPELDLSVSVLTNSPMRFVGACPDHSPDESQRQGPQRCVVQELFDAFANAAPAGSFSGRGPGDDETAEADLVESSAAQCDERVLFQYPPADLAAIELIIPMGNMNDSHVTPVDHAYFVNQLQPEKEIDVFSPAEGIVTKIQRMAASIMEGVDAAIDDHRIIIDHPCSVSSYYIHIDNLAPRLQAEGPPPGGFVQVQIPVEAGELLGTYTQNLDYNMVDLNFTLDGFLVPSSYAMEPWKIHIPNYFDYYTPEIQEQFVAKSPRTIEPIAGQFAYDIDGRLVGTWFQKDTNGYAGADLNRYWAGHLTFAYDKYDPRAIVVSVGTFDGRSTQGVVTGNSPDPADVTIESGLILYELRPWDYYADGTFWNGWNLVKGPTLLPRTESYGVIAVELVGDRELRVETFPGLKPADIEGFSTAALTYVR